MSNENYFVVEARLPIQISDASSVEEAARKAARIIENQYGVNISNWYLRVFEYGAGEGSGPINEFFSNPSGSKFRKIDENIANHKEIVDNELRVQSNIEE
jgi:hypothetical protein